MLVAESRPRNLRWFHAGPLLYGDWGTSRLYVLGLAFFYTGHTTVAYLAAIGVLMAVVAWAYTVICRTFPDGGGVYTAARQLSPTLSVIGATLLLCGYIITAVISTVEAFHYFGVPDGPTLVALSCALIAATGAVNWFGARSAGTFALVIAFVALVVSGITALLCVPFIGPGLRSISFTAPGPPWASWVIFTQIVLALSGVEAVANMTGLMKKPVERTSKRTILPVLVEVVALNLLFGIVLIGLPQVADLRAPLAQTYADAQGTLPPGVRAYRDTAMKVVATEGGSYWLGDKAGFVFGKTAAIVFGLLLLSASNTAVMAMVSVLYAMGQDREIPRSLAKLNYSGVPWIGLIVACLAPIAVVLVERDPERLAELYIIGVCGAITINVLSCAVNRRLDLGGAERAGMWALGLFLAGVTATIVVTRLNATLFAGGVVSAVLLTRAGIAWRRRRLPEPIPVPAAGWLAEVKRAPAALDSGKPRIMLAARGRSQSEFAVDLARRRKAILFAVYVRTLRVIDVQPGRVPRVEDDPGAQEALGTTAVLAREAGVPFVPIYVTSADIAAEILDYTVTYGCDTLIMGKSRRSLFARTIGGDVIAQVADQLPDGVALITRSADTLHPTAADLREPSAPEPDAGEPPPT